METCTPENTRALSSVDLRNTIHNVQVRCSGMVDTRELALVNTKLEEAIFWCEKHCVENLGIPVQELMLSGSTECCEATGNCDTAA